MAQINPAYRCTSSFQASASPAAAARTRSLSSPSDDLAWRVVRRRGVSSGAEEVGSDRTEARGSPGVPDTRSARSCWRPYHPTGSALSMRTLKEDRMLTIVTSSEIPPDTRRGGRVQTLLSPRTVGSTSGFMGIAAIDPGDAVAEHYHPYSEEFVYVVKGRLDLYADDERHELSAGQGVVLPINTRHRLVNAGTEEAQIVFQLGPLAPRPELGHVDTEHERLDRESNAPTAPASSGTPRRRSKPMSGPPGCLGSGAGWRPRRWASATRRRTPIGTASRQGPTCDRQTRGGGR